MAYKHIFRICSVVALLFFAGCAGKSGGYVGYNNPHGIVCADLKKMPQDLTAYTKKAGGGKLLLSPAEQQTHAKKARDWFFFPWKQTKAYAEASNALWAYYGMRPDGAYTENRTPFPLDFWMSLKSNCNAGAYPSLTIRAITVRNTSLRAMPTERPYYKNPDTPGEGYPFDYFQHTALWVGTPVFLSHKSSDGKWFLAETRLASGWIPAADVAVVTDSFITEWEGHPLAAIVKDKVILHDGSQVKGASRTQKVQAHIGTLLPLLKNQRGTIVLYPTRSPSGEAGIGRVALQRGEGAKFPLRLSPDDIAALGNNMMNQPYGWGGISENRDCSAMTRDLFLPFGIWLPRNSAAQAVWGRPLNLAGKALTDKERTIVTEATPFFSLIWLPGHIGLYLGEYKGKPVMFHNMWGLRVRELPAGTGREGRVVVGKAVVTSLSPGAELHGISTPGSLLDRIGRVSILPEAAHKSSLAQGKKVSPPKGKNVLGGKGRTKKTHKPTKNKHRR